MTLEEIGEGDNSLLCLTNKSSCCSETSEGEWYGPYNMKILDNMDSNADFYTSRGPSLVRLNKVNDKPLSGVFHCKIPDAQGINQTIYIGIYSNGSGNTCMLII